jgi:hypothetical protein
LLRDAQREELALDPAPRFVRQLPPQKRSLMRCRSAAITKCSV